MKNLPKKIYLQIGDDCPNGIDFNELVGVSWSRDRINKNDIKFKLEPRKMKKKLFIKAMEALEQQYFNDLETAMYLSKAFPEANPGVFMPDNHFISNALIMLLQEAMNDTELCQCGMSWIEYFMHETNFGMNDNRLEVDVNGKNFPLNNAGDLYDILSKK